MRARAFLSLLLICSLITNTRGGDVVSEYHNRTKKLTVDAVTAAWENNPERWTKISMKLRYRIDPAGRIHDIDIVSAVRNKWAEVTARRALSALKLPPVPKEVMRAAGMDGCRATLRLVLARSESDFRELQTKGTNPHN